MRMLHLAPHDEAGSGIAPYGESFRAALRDSGVEVEQLEPSVGPLNSVADVRAYAASAAARASEFQVVHAEIGGGALRQFYGALAVERRSDVPVFLTVHDPPHLAWWPFHTAAVRSRPRVAGAVRRLAAPAADALERFVVRGAGGIFVLTEKAVSQLIGLGADATRVHVLPYPVREYESAVAPRLSEADLVVGFHGFWYHGKGLEHLVDAIAKARDVGVTIRARLWGDISPTAGKRLGDIYRNYIRNLVRDNKLQDLVSFDGYLPDEQLGPALRGCDVIVLPYSAGDPADAPLASTSAAMYDSLAAGVPVVASDTRAIREMVEPGRNGLLFPAGDAAALSAALISLVKDRALLTTITAGARDTAASLSPERSANVSIAAYEAALQRG